MAVRHYRAPRRDRSGGSWQGQSGRSGGQINANGASGGYQAGGGQNASGGQQAGGGGARPKVPGRFLPPGHEGYAGQHQQRMGQMQPGPIEMSNIFNLLNALNGEMPASP